MLQKVWPYARIAALAALFAFMPLARADETAAQIDLQTFTCQEHTDTYFGGPKSSEYTSDRQVYFMIWLAGHEDTAKRGIDTEETTALADGVLKTCGDNPALKVIDVFKNTAAGVSTKASEETEDAKFPCFLLAAVSSSEGDNYELKTLVAWLSGQIAGRARETVFDFEKFKTEASGVFAYCSDAKNAQSDIGTALQALRE